MDTPLASLSLTHVHYVSQVLGDIPSHPILTLTPLESRGSPVLHLRMASSTSPSPLRVLCHSMLGIKRNGGHLNVCWATGL